ncbi:MAG TPA: ABC transporter permease [Chloroflexota bacterium]|nr:ABC transporter permease [Chloroflexota bacterium]
MTERTAVEDLPGGAAPDSTAIAVPGRAAGRIRIDPARALRQAVPPAIVFVLLILAWEYGIKLFNIPDYTLPPPSRIIHTLPTIGELKADTYYTVIREALPGYLIGSVVGFAGALIATRFRFFARGLLPYAVITNSVPIVGFAPIALVLFGIDWQSKAFIAAVLTSFPMFVNAYRGLTSIDSLSLQLMRSYAAGWWATFFKLRLPASLPYVFNALKINTSLAMIGAIIGEYFGGQAQGLGYFIEKEDGSLVMDDVWAAVVVACAIGIAAYLIVVALERILTSWHISFRAGR